MNRSLTPVWNGIILAVVLWTVTFGTPLGERYFWWLMTASTFLLGGLAVVTERARLFGNPTDRSLRRTLFWGIGSALILYTVFTAGDMLIAWLSFQDHNVQAVYDTRAQVPEWLIGLLLALVIAPSEELFWRGLVQKRLTAAWGFKYGYVTTFLIYGLVHIGSLNPILILAGLICGAFWGALYRLTHSILPPLISHIIWDVLIFVVIPLR